MNGGPSVAVESSPVDEPREGWREKGGERERERELISARNTVAKNDHVCEFLQQSCTQ